MKRLLLDMRRFSDESRLGLNFSDEWEDDDAFYCIGSTYDDCNHLYDTDLYVFAEDEGLYVRVRTGDEEWEKLDFFYRDSEHGDDWHMDTHEPLCLAHQLIQQHHFGLLRR